MMGVAIHLKIEFLEEITYQAYSPIGLDLKLLKLALKGPPKIPLE